MTRGGPRVAFCRPSRPSHAGTTHSGRNCRFAEQSTCYPDRAARRGPRAVMNERERPRTQAPPAGCREGGGGPARGAAAGGASRGVKPLVEPPVEAGVAVGQRIDQPLHLVL